MNSIFSRMAGHLSVRFSFCTKFTRFDATATLKNTNNCNRNNNLEFRFGVQCYYYSCLKNAGGDVGIKSKSKSKKMKKSLVVVESSKSLAAAAIMDEEDKNGGFFVVRKGDVVGVYNNLTDCQAQVGSSVCDPPVSVYKGYKMSKGAEAYLHLRGLKNALYSIRAADLTEELFGRLVPCPFQHPPHVSIVEPERKFQEVLGSQTGPACILEFDGACKGNPGQSGAGAVLRSPDGILLYRFREGLGIATNNVAEYRAMILGLRCALSKGFTSICVVGDSKLVCMQIQGLWRVRNQNISKWFEEAKKLKDEFLFFQINHVLRDKNSAADAQANLAVALAVGEVQEEEIGIYKKESQSQQSMVF